MRIGLIARADNTGLGNQTYEFYKHMKPHKTMVVDISSLNGNQQYPERYPDGFFVHGFPNKGDIEEFLKDLDIIFVAESPYNYWLYERAHQLGIKVAVQYNYEFFDWYSYPHYPKADLLIAPSRWHYQEIDEYAKSHNIKHVYLHCPVDRSLLPFKERTESKNFLHVAGKPAAWDRNGTESVIDAVKLCKEDITMNITVQTPSVVAEWIRRAGGDPRIKFYETSRIENYADLYKDMDALVLPRRYGGNCLPLNEALSVGMPVIMTDIEPNNILLPNWWLVPAQKVGEFKPRMIVDIYGVNPHLLAEHIDNFARRNADQVRDDSRLADSIASQIDWEVMAPMYRKAFEEVL